MCLHIFFSPNSGWRRRHPMHRTTARRLPDRRQPIHLRMTILLQFHLHRVLLRPPQCTPIRLSGVRAQTAAPTTAPRRGGARIRRGGRRGRDGRTTAAHTVQTIRLRYGGRCGARVDWVTARRGWKHGASLFYSIKTRVLAILEESKKNFCGSECQEKIILGVIENFCGWDCEKKSF